MTCLPTYKGKRYNSLEEIKSILQQEKSSNEDIQYNDKGEVLAHNGMPSKLFKDIEKLVEEQNKLPEIKEGYKRLYRAGTTVYDEGNWWTDDLESLNWYRDNTYDTIEDKEGNIVQSDKLGRINLMYVDVPIELAKQVKTEGRGRGNDEYLFGTRHETQLNKTLIQKIPNIKQQALQLYKQTRSKEFKEWFGDWITAQKTGNYTNISRVIDENGEPLIVYHGTEQPINTFSLISENRTSGTSAIKKAIYFTNDKYIANQYTLNRDVEVVNILEIIKSVIDKSIDSYIYNKDRTLIETIKNALKVENIEDDFLDNLNDAIKNENYEQITNILFTIVQFEYFSESIWGYLPFKYLEQDDKVKIVKAIINNDNKIINNLIEKYKSKNTYDTATIIPTFLNIKTPLLIENKYKQTISNSFYDKVVESLGKENISNKQVVEKLNNLLEDKDGLIVKNVDEKPAGINYKLKYELKRDENIIETTYAVFEPNQIKSVFNQGTFSKENDNIYKQEQVTQPEIDSILEEFADNLTSRFNIPFKLVSESEAKQANSNYNGEPAFYNPTNKTAYLVKSRANKTSAIHEIFTHPFLLQIEKTNSKLYINLLKEAKSNKDVVDYVDRVYKNNKNKDHEYVARAVDLYVQGELNQQKDKGLIARIKELFTELSDYLKKLFFIQYFLF